MLARAVAVASVIFLTSGVAPPLRAELIIKPPSPVVTVQVRPGVTVKYLALRKSGRPTPSDAVMLFAGGNGLLNLSAKGTIGTTLAGNFLVRSRQKFAENGLLVAVVDTPNQVPIDGNVRLSKVYASDMGKVIADVRSRLGKGGRVWIVGTSSGTLSVAGVASQLPQASPLPAAQLPDGAVLTSTQTRLVKGFCGRTVFDAKLAAINVPSLVVSHVADGCSCSPAKNAAKVVAALANAPAKEDIEFSGGKPPISKDPCQAMTPHGFLGIEDSVVEAIAKWIATH